MTVVHLRNVFTNSFETVPELFNQSEILPSMDFKAVSDSELHPFLLVGRVLHFPEDKTLFHKHRVLLLNLLHQFLVEQLNGSRIALLLSNVREFLNFCFHFSREGVG